MQFAQALAAAGLPRPLFNARLETPEGHLYPDVYWPEAGVVVEVAGRAFHYSPAAWEADLARSAALAAAGVAVLTVTWRQLQDPAACTQFLSRLAGALAARPGPLSCGAPPRGGPVASVP